MTDLKVPTSDRYRDFQIECLKNPEHAAAYIEAILEEEDPEPQLLRNALRKVIEARFPSKLLSENDELLHQRLDAMLTKSGCGEIYALVEFLDAVDLKLTIPLKANRMKNNRVPTSDRWRDALIESLKDQIFHKISIINLSSSSSYFYVPPSS
ncbi:MAG: transcriptional regulator [Hormoscilla sp. GM7CHS1pb]|nr:transcriptional regulator [Hormoscilla sp. GM7CHS1pb]